MDILNEVKLNNISFSNNKKIVIIGGINVIESEELAMQTAEVYKNVSIKHNLDIIFKASYDKANRSSIYSFRGPGIKKGLKVLEKIKHNFQLPVISDVHSPEEALEASQVLDIIQQLYLCSFCLLSLP